MTVHDYLHEATNARELSTQPSLTGRIISVLRRILEVPAVHCRLPPLGEEELKKCLVLNVKESEGTSLGESNHLRWAGQQAPAAPDYSHYLNVPKFTSGGKDVTQMLAASISS